MGRLFCAECGFGCICQGGNKLSALTGIPQIDTDLAAYLSQVGHVFALGRTAILLLGDGRSRASVQAISEGWRGTPEMKAVLLCATQAERAARYPTVRAFVDAWRQAAGPRVKRWAEGA